MKALGGKETISRSGSVGDKKLKDYYRYKHLEKLKLLK